MFIAIAGGLLAMAPAMADGYNLIKLLFMAAGAALFWAGMLRAPIRRTALDLPLAALWLAMLASAVQSADPPASVFGSYPQAFYGLLPLSVCAAIYYASAQIADEGEKDDVLRWILVVALLLALFGISQRFMVGRELLLYPRLMDNRIMSTIGAPVMFGACLVPLAPIALHWALEKKSLLGRICCALIAASLLLTWARGAWFSAGGAAAAYLWLSGRVTPRRWHFALLILLVPAAMFGLQKALRKSDSDSIRVESLKSSLAAIESRPLLGFGPDAFEFAFRRFRSDALVRVTHDSAAIQSNAHDDLLQAAVTLGALGLLAYVWLLWALSVRLYRSLSNSVHGARDAAIAAALLGLFLQAKVNPIPPAGLMIAALLAGLVCGGDQRLSRSAGRAASSVAAVSCALAFAVLARFCVADADYKSGSRIVRSTALPDPAYMDGVNRLRRATELNPWRLDYLAARCDVILDAAAIAPPAQGRQLIEKALLLTADAVRRHPANGTAHYMRATALALSAVRFGTGRLAEASAEIKTASELDPTFTFVMRRRMEIDHALGDRADYDQVNDRYRRIIATARETAPWRPLLK